MVSTPRQRSGPTVARMILGLRLRWAREEAGLSREQAGKAIRGSNSKISRVELGRVGGQDRDVAGLATLYGVTDPVRREALLVLAQESRKRHPSSDVMPDWLATYVDLEEAASVIRVYELQFVPGLLQTQGYARAVIAGGRSGADEAEIERRVTARITRGQLLVNPDPPRLWAVIDESALHRVIGSPAVMRAQLEHLLEAAKLPRITLQVMPAETGAHAAEGGAFSLLRFPYPEMFDVVYIEHLTRGFHLDDPAEVETYIRAADALSVHAATPADSAELITELRDRLPRHAG